MRSVLVALQFMTRLPLPRIDAREDDFGRAIRWFPLTGMVVGAALAAAGWIGARQDPALGALLALVAWVGLTGALHLDGLGDIADAAGAVHADRARLAEVLADPHLGSFGVAAIALQLITKFVLLWLLMQSSGPEAPLALVAVLGRIGPIAWARFLPPLHEGFGTLFRAGAGAWVLFTWLAAWSLGAALTAPVLLLAPLVIPLWALWLRRHIGGISGDGHGAGIELVETAGLLVLLGAR